MGMYVVHVCHNFPAQLKVVILWEKIEQNNFTSIFPHIIGIVRMWQWHEAFIVTFPKENLFTLDFLI